MSTTYTAALQAFAAGRRQEDVAEQLDCQQGSLSRYLNGRLPSREIAEKFDERSKGAVPLALWRVSKAVQLGIAA
jgi:hypothetical protein